jgi:myo-inositol-1-phosphate synthase
MKKEIRIAIVGLGNCASALIQGLYYYKNVKDEKSLVPGLMHNVLGGYKISDIKVVAVFDVDKRKVGKDVSEAMFAPPNCTKVFCKDIPKMGVKVKMGPVLDGVAPHMKDYPEDKTFVVANKKPVDVVKELKKSGAEILINYLPVGSQKATEYYANCALKAGCAFINCIPVFIVSSKKWAEKFEKRGLPCIGDDIKSQVGATIVHRTLCHLFTQRGVIIDRSYQLNFGGNSVTGDQMILVRINGKMEYISIGELIDSLMKKYKPQKEKGKEILTEEKIREKIECFTIDDEFKVKLVKVSAFIRHKIKEPIFEVELEGGRKIKITKDHNLFVLNDRGKLEPIPASDLKENESLVAVPENLFCPQPEKKFFNLKPYLKEIIGASSYQKGKIKVKKGFIEIVGYPNFKIPVKFPLSDEFLQIVGLWLADGSYDRKGKSYNIELACGNDKECLKIVSNFCEKLGLTFSIGGKKKVKIRIHSKVLGRIFEKIFKLKGTAFTKRVPSWVFDLSDRQIAQVLKGYVSGDGGITGKQIRWTSISRKLIEDIQTLFLRIGINSTIFKEEYSKNHSGYHSKFGYCWHGLITGYKDFKNFVEKVGFIQKEKNKKAIEILKKEKKESLKEKLIPNLPVLRRWKIKSTTWWKCPQISAKIVLAQLEKINPDFDLKQNLYNVCTGETKFLRVKKIKKISEKKEKYVYDLSVKPYERFICSNVLVHNTDFLNMLSRERLKSKKISKTEAVESQLAKRLSYDDLHIGPSDWIPWLKDNKICYIRIEGRKFGNVPVELELRLSVEDSPNSAGCVIDAIRLAKIALDRKIGGPLISASAYLMKHPPQQFTDEKAREMVEEFIKGERER